MKEYYKFSSLMFSKINLQQVTVKCFLIWPHIILIVRFASLSINLIESKICKSVSSSWFSEASTTILTFDDNNLVLSTFTFLRQTKFFLAKRDLLVVWRDLFSVRRDMYTVRRDIVQQDFMLGCEKRQLA
jgi:hypothetical protein